VNDRERFIRAIEAEPDDDTARLVFADWLEENSDADRARFIRLQCEHHWLKEQDLPRAESRRRRELEKEIDALLKRHRAAWTAGLPAWTEKESFKRGFLHIWQMTGKQFLEAAGPLRAITPLDTLFLRLLKGKEAAVFASEHLGGLSRLWVQEAQLTDAGIALLTSSPHLGRVRKLGVARVTLGDSKDANRLTDASAIALAGADNLPALVDLDLSGYRKVTLAGVRAIVESPRRAGLTALNVSGGAGGPAVAELFRGPACRLTGLEELRLNDLKLGDAGAEALAGAASLRHLRVLWLTQNRIGDRGATALATSPHLTELTDLDLWKNNLTDRGVEALLDSPGLRSVRKLQLGDNPKITDASARAIRDDGRAWQKVGLDGTQVSPELRASVAARCERSAAGGSRGGGEGTS
jgi:uncharacterized protein (TIGR02996 family)